jgi:hypothetical protein
MTADAAEDAQHDIGAPSARYKDLYLSGGVYLGGTGAANLLNDYEEGTWTPTIVGSTSGSITSFTTATAIYTKVGNQVVVQCFLTGIDVTSSTISGEFRIGGLPFAPTANRQSVTVHNCNIFNFDEETTSISGFCTSASQVVLQKGSSVTRITDADESTSSSASIMLGIIYQTS